MGVLKDIYCITKHLEEYVEDVKYKKIADFTKPCENCKYNLRCSFDAYNHFKILTRITGIKIHPGITKKN